MVYKIEVVEQDVRIAIPDFITFLRHYMARIENQ